MAMTDGIGAADPASLAAALVASLEQALLAAERLLGALEPAASRRPGGATSPVPGRARAGYVGAGQAPVPLEPPATRPARGAGVAPGLSPREAEVLGLLAAGHSNRRIAQILFLSPRTVQRHAANVYLKIGAHCRAAATAYALRHGLA